MGIGECDRGVQTRKVALILVSPEDESPYPIHIKGGSQSETGKRGLILMCPKISDVNHLLAIHVERLQY